MLLLLALVGYFNETLIDDYIFDKILLTKSQMILKEVALKYILYTASKKLLLQKYLKKFFQLEEARCYAFLLGSFLGHKSAFAKLNTISDCENIGLSTKAVRELVKISFDDKWANTIEHNLNAINILNLKLSKADKFVSYETCGVGHRPISQLPTFLTNTFYAIESNENEDKEGCNKLAFKSSIIYMILNNLNHDGRIFLKKLDKTTKNTSYKGTLKNVLYQISKELNTEIDLKYIKTANFKYLLNRYISLSLPENNHTKSSLNSYKILLTKISERFLITYIFEKTKSHKFIIKVMPYKIASSYWSSRFDNLFKSK
jgi:hypothetical protein